MNYILDAEGWQKALKNIYDHLKKNGLFIFDVSTVFNSQKDFSKYVHRETFKNGSYFRKSFYDRRNFIQINSFEIKLPTHPKVIFCERHQQRIRPLSEIVQFITQSPFTLLAGYKEFTFTPFDEECERVHFVLRKEPQKYVRTS
jgi:hypothetical protein